MEAAQDEDIAALGIRGYGVSTKLFLRDVYVGEVNASPNGNQQTVEVIQRNIKNYNPRLGTLRSLTLSTQPIIPQEIADKGVEKAKRGRKR